jgi:hypothetical protein
MSVKMKVTEYGAPTKQILAIPDHYVAFGVTHTKATAGAPGIATLVHGKYIVQAGTVYPANDATAKGIVLNDYDVTDGDQQMAVVRHGFIKTTALPVAVSDLAKSALRLIEFVDPVA